MALHLTVCQWMLQREVIDAMLCACAWITVNFAVLLLLPWLLLLLIHVSVCRSLGNNRISCTGRAHC